MYKYENVYSKCLPDVANVRPTVKVMLMRLGGATAVCGMR